MEGLAFSDPRLACGHSIDEETIKKYVVHQGQEDSGQLRMEL